MCPEEFFEGKNCKIKVNFLHQLVNLSCWFSRFWRKNVANITKAAFYLSRLTFCYKKCFGEKEFNTCGFSGKKSQISGGKVSGRNFWGNNFCKKRYFESFIVFGRESFKLFPKSSHQSCHNSILRIQRMNSRKKILEVYSSLIFSDTAQNF